MRERWIHTSFIDEKVEYFGKYGAYRKFLHHQNVIIKMPTLFTFCF